MPHKEHYRLNLPHFQQPGQAYFITWCIKDAVPAHALKSYTQKLEILRSQLNNTDWNSHHPCTANSGSGGFQLAVSNTASDVPNKNSGLETAEPKLKQQYYALRSKYIKAYNNLLDTNRNPKINLSKPELNKVIINALKFWEGKKLTNHAYCIMPNHVHWVVELFEKDEKGKPVYLEDILKSVKQFSATEINKLVTRKGRFWQKESFDTTLRNERHLYYTIEYTLNNPVNAGLVKSREDWAGSGSADSNLLFQT